MSKRTTEDPDAVAMTGVVEKLWCSKPNYSAGLLSTHDFGAQRIAGSFYCDVGACISIEGRWTDDPKYGRQIHVKTFAYALTSESLDKSGLAHYLATSPDFVGLGPVKARKLADKYGDDFGGALEDRIEEMAKSVNLQVEALERIRMVWRNNRAKNGLAAWLGQWSLTHSQTQKIIAAFGESARKAIEENPYVLIDRVDGFGWATVDGIAMRMGVSKEHPGRVRAGILHAVAKQLEEGSTWTAREQVARIAGELLFLDSLDAPQKIEAALDGILAEQPRAPLVADGGRVADRYAYEAEAGVFSWLRAARAHRTEKISSIDGEPLNAGQLLAVLGALGFQATVITGSAGTGKTYVVASVIKAMQRHGLKRIAMCAFAGKAARRMTESVRAYGIKGQAVGGARDPFTGEETQPALLCCEGQTIHRLLGYTGEGRFFYHENNKINVDAVFLDEFSMVPASLLWSLLQALDPTRTRVIFVGDQHQLPPIGGGNPLRDILRHDLIPVYYLDEVMRQAGELKRRCSDVLRGVVEPHRPTTLEEERQPWYLITPARHEEAEAVQATLLDLVENRIGKLTLANGKPPDLIRDIQIITPVHKGVLGTVALNTAMQALIQRLVYGRTAVTPKEDQRPKPMRGDKVIQVKNNYKLDVMNGTLGIVESIALEPEDIMTKTGKVKVKAGDMFVLFDGKDAAIHIAGDNKSDVQVAYALSIHKCVSPDTIVETDRGLLPISEIEPSGRIATSAGAFAYGDLVQNPRAAMLRIRTKDGYSIDVTPDHRLAAWDGSAYQLTEACALRVGQFLRLKMGNTIDPSAPVSLPSLPVGDVRAVAHRVPACVTPEVAEFLGLMVADGTVYRNGFRLAKRHEDVALRFSDLCVALFGVKPKEFLTLGAYHREVSSVLLSDWLVSLDGLSPHDKDVPPCVLRSSLDCQSAFLRGLFADGTVNVKEGKLDHIEFCTIMDNVAKMVQIILLRIGIISSRKFVKAAWRIYIYGQNAIRFRDKIGFVSQWKRDRLNAPCGNESKYVIPVSKDSVSYQTSPGCNAKTRGTLSRHAAEKIGRFVGDLQFHHSKIESIEEVFGRSMCVRVPETGTFLQNGFDGSNCQGSEWPIAIAITSKSHAYSQSRSMLYTAVTRARQIAILIGDAWGCRHAAGKVVLDSRRTWLDAWSLDGGKTK